MDAVTIYTDGGCEPNPGTGGWGVVLIHDKTGTTNELNGGEKDSTNNRMELIAAIQALKALKRKCQVRLYTDSEYLKRGITEWMPSWNKRGKLEKGKIKNADLWLELRNLVEKHEIQWEWVKGHSGVEHNERADALAYEAIVKIRNGQLDAPERYEPTEGPQRLF